MDWSVLRPHAKYPLLRPELIYVDYIPVSRLRDFNHRHSLTKLPLLSCITLPLYGISSSLARSLSELLSR